MHGWGLIAGKCYTAGARHKFKDCSGGGEVVWG